MTEGDAEHTVTGSSPGRRQQHFKSRQENKKAEVPPQAQSLPKDFEKPETSQNCSPGLSVPWLRASQASRHMNH